MLDEPNSADAELYRMLRTSLEVTALQGGCRSIMITSALAQEGKSTTAANLAIALARTGRHVMLVDLDLRRPSLDRFFALRGRPGMTDLVFGRSSIGDAGSPSDVRRRPGAWLRRRPAPPSPLDGDAGATSTSREFST